MTTKRKYHRVPLGHSTKDLLHCDYCHNPVKSDKSMTASNGKTTCYDCLKILEGPTEFCSFECIATGKCDGNC